MALASITVERAEEGEAARSEGRDLFNHREIRIILEQIDFKPRQARSYEIIALHPSVHVEVGVGRWGGGYIGGEENKASGLLLKDCLALPTRWFLAL